MSKRREVLVRPARRVIRISRPFQSRFKLRRVRCDCGLADKGIEDEKTVLRDFADNDKTAVVSFGNRGQRGFGKPFPRAVDGTRLQLQFFRAAQHLLNADGVAILMRELLRIDGDAVKAQHQHQSRKSGCMGSSGEFRCSVA